MAYSSTNPLTLLVAGQPGQTSLYGYTSTHNSTQVLATGFFTGVGAGGRGNNIPGVKFGDVILSVASTGAAIPGRVSFHSCIASTPTFTSTNLSSAWGTQYDVSVSGST